MIENLREVSTIGQRLVSDYFQSLHVKLHEYTIPKESLLSCKQVHFKYDEAHQKTKKIESNKEIERKRKMKEDEVVDIKRQKLSLELFVKSI